MDFFKDPYSIMLMSSMFKNKNNTLMSLFIVFITIVCKFIPFSDISDIISKYLNKYDDEISLIISTFEVPCIRNYSSVPITKMIYSSEFLSIVHYICNSDCSNITSYTQIMANNSELNFYSREDKDNKNQFIYMPLTKNKFKIYDNIYCYIINKEIIENNESNDKNKKNNIIKNNYFIINLTIHKTEKNGMDKLKNFVKKCLEEYNLFLSSKKDDKNNLFLYEYTNSEKIDSNIELKFNKYPLEHNKDLSINIFFEGKDKLISYIKPFIYDPLEKINLGEEKYKRSGFTFKAGLLFYGYPGCGKTSTIKAILKYTNRHGIMINLSKVKTCEELMLIFRRRCINGNILEGKQICFILEDCDAFENNIIQSREENKIDIKNCNPNSNSQELKEISKFMESTAINLKDIINSEDKVNLSCFLNILDGIIELHGVMIIMTTNHPEKIDKALIRPGRFDFKYEFKRCSKNIIKEMLQFKYEISDKIMNQYFDKLNIKDEILSPAEIQSICFRNDNIENCINEILFESQK